MLPPPAVPAAKMVRISGMFLTKVFDGPYKNIRKWVQEMEVFLTSQGKDARKICFFYTTCPRCAKHYGKNYVVILAQI